MGIRIIATVDIIMYTVSESNKHYYLFYIRCLDVLEDESRNLKLSSYGSHVT